MLWLKLVKDWERFHKAKDGYNVKSLSSLYCLNKHQTAFYFDNFLQTDYFPPAAICKPGLFIFIAERKKETSINTYWQPTVSIYYTFPHERRN